MILDIGFINDAITYFRILKDDTIVICLCIIAGYE
jgi:hypothetical protein